MLICGQLLEGNGYCIHACFLPSGFISYYSACPFYSFSMPSLWVSGSSLCGEIPSLSPYLLFTGLANSSFSSQLKGYSSERQSLLSQIYSSPLPHPPNHSLIILFHFCWSIHNHQKWSSLSPCLFVPFLSSPTPYCLGCNNLVFSFTHVALVSTTVLDTE